MLPFVIDSMLLYHKDIVFRSKPHTLTRAAVDDLLTVYIPGHKSWQSM